MNVPLVLGFLPADTIFQNLGSVPDMQLPTEEQLCGFSQDPGECYETYPPP